MAQEKFSFRKETKLKIKFLILFIFSFNIQSSNLVLDFNNLVVNNFEFTQKTETNSSTTESKGKILRMENEIKIEITEPSKELYTIIENKVEVYDYDFNQTSIYQIDENNGRRPATLRNCWPICRRRWRPIRRGSWRCNPSLSGRVRPWCNGR